MLQDIFPKIYNNHYVPKEPENDSFSLIVHNNEVLLKETENGITYPKYNDISDLTGKSIYLFSIDDRAFFLFYPDSQDYNIPNEMYQVDGYEFCHISKLRHKSPKYLCYAGVVANQLANWYRNNQYCGRCGKTITFDDKERMLRCNSCGNIVYPKISPAVIVAITNQDKILLTKYAGQQDNPRFALIAGFTEIGETVEETVKREVMEEVGLRVKNIRYYKSQPWPFSDTLLLGFFCELDGSPHITMDPVELSVAQWISRKDIDFSDDDVSLTYEMIASFRQTGN